RVTPIVVNETLAHRFFGTADPIGRQLVLERGGGSGPDRTLQIAGIARDSKMRSLDEDPHPVVYLPEVGDFFFVRLAGAASSALRMVEQAVSAAEPAAWVQAQALESQVELARMPARIGGSALAALGASRSDCRAARGLAQVRLERTARCILEGHAERERERDFDAGVRRGEVAVREVLDSDLDVQAPRLADEGADGHLVLEGERGA